MIQTKIKLIVATPVIKTKILDGKKKFKITTAKKIPAEASIPFTGTSCFDNLANIFGACLFSPRMYKVRDVEKMAELAADIADVKTTKLTKSAAAGKPIPAKTCTNGDWLGFNWFHGKIDMITIIDPT